MRFILAEICAPDKYSILRDEFLDIHSYKNITTEEFDEDIFNEIIKKADPLRHPYFSLNNSDINSLINTGRSMVWGTSDDKNHLVIIDLYHKNNKSMRTIIRDQKLEILI